MLSQERIKLMTKMAAYEENEEIYVDRQLFPK